MGRSFGANPGVRGGGGVVMDKIDTCIITMLRVKRHFFSRAISRTSFLTEEVKPQKSLFPSVFTSHSAFNSRVSEVSKIVLTFLMMSEARWMAVEHVVFFSKRIIVIKLQVTVYQNS